MNTPPPPTTLRTLNIGDRGIVANFRTANSTLVTQLKDMGIMPGVAIALERKTPRFMVKTCHHVLALSEGMINAIEVRPMDHRTGLTA